MSTSLATSHDPKPVREFAALGLVDSALALTAHREFFACAEAAMLLHDVRVSVRDVHIGAAVASVVNDALVSYRQSRLLDRWRVVDPLLDIRLELARGRGVEASASGPSVPSGRPRHSEP